MGRLGDHVSGAKIDTMAPIDLYPFRFRDQRTGKWVRARYLATLAELAARYREWEIVGLAETRGDAPVQMFQPAPRTERPPDQCQSA